MQLENTADVGGGQNIGYLDIGDYADYYITVQQSGTYNVQFRTASESAGGAVQLELVDSTAIQLSFKLWICHLPEVGRHGHPQPRVFFCNQGSTI